MILKDNFYIKIKFNLRNNMKKVLLTILAGMFLIGSAYAQPSFTIGLGLNKINRTKVFKYNDSIFGMVKKVKHLVKYEIK